MFSNETKWYEICLRLKFFWTLPPNFVKFFGIISDSFDLQKFLTHNMKAMAKDKKFNIAVT